MNPLKRVNLWRKPSVRWYWIKFYIHNFATFANELNNNLYIKLIDGLSNGKWAFTGPKQTRPKNILVEKLRRFLILHYLLIAVISRKPTPYQNHLGISLAAQLMFEEHLKVITTKLNKTMGLLLKFTKKFTVTGINNYA